MRETETVAPTRAPAARSEPRRVPARSEAPGRPEPQPPPAGWRRAVVSASVVVLLLAVVVVIAVRSIDSGDAAASPPVASTVAPAVRPVTTCPLKAEARDCWATQTGVPGYTEAQIVAGVSPLKHVLVDVMVTEPGAVIDNQWIEGCISIRADNVTIRNSLVRTQHPCTGGNGQAAPSVINAGNGDTAFPGVVTGLRIEDTEVDAMNADFDFVGIGAAGYTCVRCNVHGGVKNFWAGSDVVIRDSYSHDLSSANGEIHSASIDADSSTNVTIDHSFVDARGATFVTAAVQDVASYGPGSGLTINESYLEGADGADLAMAAVHHDVHITNNAFSNHNGYGGTKTVYGFNPENAGMVWSGNVVAETGAPIAMPTGP